MLNYFSGVMAGLAPIGANIGCPRAFCSLAPHPKSGLPDLGTKHVEIGYSRFRLRGEGRGLSTRSDSRRGPLTRRARARRPLPTEVGFTRLRHLKKDRNRQQPISIAGRGGRTAVPYAFGLLVKGRVNASGALRFSPDWPLRHGTQTHPHAHADTRRAPGRTALRPALDARPG